MFPKRNCARKFTTGKGGTMVGKFELKTAKDGEFFFHLKAANGQIVLASEMYKGKSSAENGIESVKKNASKDANYERKDTKNGHFMFNLKAANHLVIGTSQTYKTAESRNEGIASVKANAPSAPIVDETA
ncbi:MAG TPA: YegP family protein [Edaphobacter sp.]|jgi:uncharacterized protein YegP (UPF0339 family)|nr:YegP family protein [Edaphobacter sp.]